MTIEPVNPADYILPDGSIDVTPENWPSPDEIRRFRSTSRDCPNCNPTAKAIALTPAQWSVAGVDRGE